ncbi:Fasciclin-like arabinogalactan protein-like protein 7 [Phlyctema vagabunda]|uniref:Fasciclin-like arabinogalactan protein-like protein 7 n=1 Tax=Phlyctema vagabunda TaxID=108571 RepID=A0ABR4PLH6_9HELO
MKSLQFRSVWCLASLISQGACISLLGVLQSYPELSSLYSYVNASANSTGLLATANNFTFLAPSNAAIKSFINQNPDTLTPSLFDATVEYSLLQGGYPSLSFTDTPIFVPSYLANGSFTNVTGGQAVELVSGSDGVLETITGNRSVSTSTTDDIICVGGIIHIINSFPSIPVAAVSEIAAAGLEYFVSILNTAGYLSATNAYVDEILAVKDVTYFIPNSVAALDNTTALAKNSTPAELQAMFQYHVVPGFVGYSTLLENGMVLQTAQGSNVTITSRDGQLYVNAAKITASDYLVANGVVHVIDNLLNRFDQSPPARVTTAVSTSYSFPTATPTANTPAANTDVPDTRTQPEKSKSGVSGTTIGIAVGVTVAGLISLAALVWCLLRARKRKMQPTAWDDQRNSVVSSDIGGKPYAASERIQREEAVFGSPSTGMNEISTGGLTGQNSPPYNARPSVPPRSPSRVIPGRGRDF